MTEVLRPGATSDVEPKNVEFVIDLTEGSGRLIWEGYTGMRAVQTNSQHPVTHEYKVCKTEADPYVEQVKECLDLFALWMVDDHADYVKQVTSVQFAAADEPYDKDALELALEDLL